MSSRPGPLTRGDARAGMPARAVVCAGAVETEYLRAGCGAPVLLLMSDGGVRWRCDDRSPAAAEELFPLLAERFRVIAPTIPIGVDFSSWLGDFLDGLGVERSSIVTDVRLAREARRFAVDQPGRLHHVAVLRDGEGAADRVLRELTGDGDAAG